MIYEKSKISLLIVDDQFCAAFCSLYFIVYNNNYTCFLFLFLNKEVRIVSYVQYKIKNKNAFLEYNYNRK